MRSTRRRAQSGQTLVEALVASLLLGVVVVVGLTMLDTSEIGAQRAVKVAWAQCVVREEIGAIRAHAFATSYPAPDNVSVSVTPESLSGATGPRQALQLVTVVANDPDPPHEPLIPAVSTYRAALFGYDQSLQPSDVLQVGDSCRHLLQGS